MRNYLLLFLTVLLLNLTGCAQDIPNKELQIAAAVMAAPETSRADATVLGYDAKGMVVTLRTGTNNMVCLADDPNTPGFNVACYHKDLDPFMARGRALKAEGKDRVAIFEMREAEAKAGTLAMPENPTTLHILSGKEGKYNPETGKVENATYRWVVYTPWATPESSGLDVKPAFPGAPWIMDPGTHRAHIMISPPNPGDPQ